MSSAPGAPSSARSLFKGIFHGTGLYSIPLLGQRLASFITLPIILYVLSKTDYGVASLLEQVAGLLSMLLGGSFSASLGYFFYSQDSAEGRRAATGTAVLGAPLMGALAGLVCFPWAVPLSRLAFGDAAGANYLRVVFMAMPVNFLVEALLTWLRVENRPGMFAAGSLLRIGITVLGIVALVGLVKLHVWGILSTAVIAAVVPAIILAVYWLRVESPVFHFRLFLAMARFALPMGLSGTAMFIVNFGDRFVLRHYRGLSEVAVYNLAYNIGMLINLAYWAFQTYWSAQVFHIMRRDDADIVFARIFTYVILGLSFCGAGIVIFSKPALRILAPPSYSSAAAVVPIIVAAYYLRSIGEFFRCLFLEQGHPRFEAVCTWLGAVVCLAGYFTLIPRYGMVGAAIATLATFVVIAVISVVWTYRLRPYSLETRRLIKLGIVLALVLIPYALVPVSSLALQIGWAVLLMAALPLTLWMLRFPTPGEREMLSVLWHSLVSRLPGMLQA